MLPQLLKQVFSFKYNDAIVSDPVYEFHTRSWLKFLHNIYYRVEHTGQVKEGLERAKQEHVIFILNHALTLEAPLVCQHVFVKGAGKVHMMVFRDAFKIPLFREYLQVGQCVPLTIKSGVQALKRRHILLFPEGMDFINTFTNGHLLSKFHAGFLRIARQYLKETGKKSVTVIPIGHAGLEQTVKFWLIRNKFIMKHVINAIINTPFMILPKLPFLLPSKVVMNWGTPTRVTLHAIRNEQAIAESIEKFRSIIKSEILKSRR